jgi:hypothetical protein
MSAHTISKHSGTPLVQAMRNTNVYLSGFTCVNAKHARHLFVTAIENLHLGSIYH